jgi:tetratricopeptide (TPR) repeat protein
LAEGLDACDTASQQLPADPSLGAEFTSYSPFLFILYLQAWILCRLGRVNEATVVSERLEPLARVRGDNEVLTWLQDVRIELDLIFANPAAALDHSRCAIEAGEKSATPEARSAALRALGTARRLNTQWDGAVEALQEAVSANISGVNRGAEGWYRAELAEALLGQGDLDKAEHEAQAAVTAAQRQHSRCDEVLANLALAHTLLRGTDLQALERVEQALVRAQELIHETGALAWHPEVHECRAHLALLRGDTEAAWRELNAARRLYAEMGATAQVERLAREIDGRGRQAALDEPGAES